MSTPGGVLRDAWLRPTVGVTCRRAQHCSIMCTTRSSCTRRRHRSSQNLIVTIVGAVTPAFASSGLTGLLLSTWRFGLCVRCRVHELRTGQGVPSCTRESDTCRRAETTCATPRQGATTSRPYHSLQWFHQGSFVTNNYCYNVMVPRHTPHDIVNYRGARPRHRHQWPHRPHVCGPGGKNRTSNRHVC